MTLDKCPVCGIFTSNLRKHKARGRCKYQHIRKNKKNKTSSGSPAVFM